ncbi:hypothetical protein GGR51DRAFT_504428 [Nemania sp. FL0031]|nr:hypothetical protein GGR51DRAFT_504428 [Nemania sp. FL0031]
MFIRTSATILTAAFLIGHAACKTDIAGCVSSETVVYGGASLIWYVPGTGEICEFLDCGGGRAPPKTTVPGCAAYEGTATYSPSYLPGFGASATSTASSGAQTTAAESSTLELASSSSSPSSSSSDNASITTPPVTTQTSTAAVETQTSSDSSVASSGSSNSASSTSSVSTAGAASPTVVMKGAFGIVAGLIGGVAMM